MSFQPSEEQQAILDYPLAPLRIAAGAGTGKTTTLAHRIARLVSDGIEPEQILGITFTNKAAEELAERVTTTLVDESDTATVRQVDVHTYHGFAASLLREFGPLVGVERSTAIITPTFGRQLFTDSLEGGEYRQLDVTYRGIVNKPAYMAATMGDHLVQAEDVRSLAPAEPDQIWLERLEIIGIVERYRAEKDRLGAVDYSDLIAKTHTLVVRFPEIASRIRSRYRAVFLDEYQDTNAAQREMLRSIFDAGFPVTAVGDADQTIYEWRGASLENFSAFARHFPTVDGFPAGSLPLSVNRRSGQAILEVANTVRASINSDLRQPLVAVEGAPVAAVHTQWFSTAMDEANAIALEIERVHEGGLAYKDMAVLFRKNKDTELVRATLEDHQIPVEVANLGGLLGIPEVGELHAWLRILHDPADSPALMRILLGSRFRLGMADIRPFAQWVRLASSLHEPTILEAIDLLAELEGFAELASDTQQSLREFREQYRSLLASAQGVSLVELVRRILDETGAWLEVEAMDDASRLSARLNLYRFLDLAEDWSPLEGRPSLGAFVDYLAAMIEDQTEEIDTARLSGEDAVSLVTIHRAKGLEWDTVFIPAMYHGNFPSFSRGYEDPISKAQVLPYELRLDKATLPPMTAGVPDKERTGALKLRHQEQELRLAYVGITRARSRLLVTGAAWYGGPEPRKTAAKPSSLFTLIEGHSASDNLGHADDGPRPDTLRIEPTSGAPDPAFPDWWDGAIRSTMSDEHWPRQRASELDVALAYDDHVQEFQDTLFSLPPPPASGDGGHELLTSVTSLVTFATCPKKYYWTNVDPLPRRPSVAARRGTEVHRKIELHARGKVPLDDAIEYDVLPTDEATDKTPGGKDAYTVYLESRFAENPPRHIEAPFRLKLDGGTIRGRVDAIYGTDDEWEIVDFKSGRNRHQTEAKEQLKAYAVAARAGAFGGVPSQVRVTFAYLGGGKLEEVSEPVDDVWISDAQVSISDQLTTMATGSLDNGTFDPSPSPACAPCDFLHVCEAGAAWQSSH